MVTVASGRQVSSSSAGPHSEGSCLSATRVGSGSSWCSFPSADEQAVELGNHVGAERFSPQSLVRSGRVGLSGIGMHPSFFGLRVWPAGKLAAVGSGGALDLAAVGAGGPVAGHA
jgi:hypothetical protein